MIKITFFDIDWTLLKMGCKEQSEKTGDMRVSFFSSQTGKCANAVSACTRLLSSKKCLDF